MFVAARVAADGVQIGADTIVYTPSPPLEPGRHVVGVEIMNSEGGKAVVQWSFEVQPAKTTPLGDPFVVLFAFVGLWAMRRDRARNASPTFTHPPDVLDMLASASRGVDVMSAPRLDDAARALLGEVDTPEAKRLEFLPFVRLDAAEPGTVAAVDGGQSILADLSSCGILAARAGFTLRRPGDVFEDRPGPGGVRTVARRRALREWAELVRPFEWAGAVEAPQLSSNTWLRAWCEAERVLYEFDAARRALRVLRSDDLLLLDGALEADQPNSPALDALIASANRDGIHVAAVTKDTTLTVGGTLPFTMEIEQVARARGAPGRFAAEVTSLLEPRPQHSSWAVRFDPVSPLYRVDIAPGDSTPSLSILRRVAGLCNDVAYPGYPYALARVHQLVHFADEESADLRAQLESAISERRGSLFSMRLFGRGRDVLALGG